MFFSSLADLYGKSLEVFGHIKSAVEQQETWETGNIRARWKSGLWNLFVLYNCIPLTVESIASGTSNGRGWLRFRRGCRYIPRRGVSFRNARYFILLWSVHCFSKDKNKREVEHTLKAIRCWSSSQVLSSTVWANWKTFKPPRDFFLRTVDSTTGSSQSHWINWLS